MNSRSETNVAKDFVSMFFPETWGLWVSLHCQEDQDNLPSRDRSAAFMLDLPFVECSIRTYVEALFWWRGFGKCIR